MTGPILVFGSGGQLGQEVLCRADAAGLEVVGLNRARADITDPGAVARAIAATRPRLILNAAAYTAVDRAEREPDLAHAVNATGAGVLAREAAAAGVPLIHISTDYVFDGRKAGAYVEADPIAPAGVYGRTKADGEAAVRAAAPQHVILRTAWVYGAYGTNFVKTMLRLARERDVLRVVADQIGCPTSTADLAEAVWAIDRTLATGAAPWGTYHFAGDGVTSWHGLAEATVAAQAEATGRRPPVRAIATQDYPTPARRPANSALDSSRFAATFGCRALPWRTRLGETVATLLHPAEVP